MNDWLKTLAPLLGTALGGPLGGAAASFIADKLGIENKTIEAVSVLVDHLAQNQLFDDGKFRLVYVEVKQVHGQPGPI